MLQANQGTKLWIRCNMHDQPSTRANFQSCVKYPAAQPNSRIQNQQVVICKILKLSLMYKPISTPLHLYYPFNKVHYIMQQITWKMCQLYLIRTIFRPAILLFTIIRHNQLNNKFHFKNLIPWKYSQLFHIIVLLQPCIVTTQSQTRKKQPQ